MVAGTWPTWRTYKSKQVRHKLLSELSFQSTCLNLCKYLSELVPHLYVSFFGLYTKIYIYDCDFVFKRLSYIWSTFDFFKLKRSQKISKSLKLFVSTTKKSHCIVHEQIDHCCWKHTRKHAVSTPDRNLTTPNMQGYRNPTTPNPKQKSHAGHKQCAFNMF